MFIIDPKTQKVKLTRGDTATMSVQIYDLDEKLYEIQPTDTITFTLRKSSKSEVCLTKEATEDHYIIINSEDTANLSTGLYKYDLQLTTEEGFVYTIIQSNYFELLSEITG